MSVPPSVENAADSILQARFTTTGTLARHLGLSRETIYVYLERLGIEPIRDSLNHRLLSPAQVKQLLAFHARRRR